MAGQRRKRVPRLKRWRLRQLVNPHFLAGVGAVGLAVAAYAGTHTYLDFHTGPGNTSDCAGCREGAPEPATPPASALADRRGASGPAVPSSVEVVHRVRHGDDDGFRTTLVLTNNGPDPVRHWRLAFSYPNGKVRTATAARLDRSGRSPVLYGKGPHATLQPGESVRIRLTGTGAGADPYGCELNGQACRFG